MARKDRSARPAGRAQIERWMDTASQALSSGDYFECERLATQSLRSAAALGDFDLVARIALPLQEARRQRRLMAVDAGRCFTWRDPVPGDPSALEIEGGCHVVFPPNVAADARRIADEALERGVPVFAFACEPQTQTGLLPVAVVGAGTIRTKIPPRDDVTVEWCLEVIDALTDEALAMLDRTKPLVRLVDDLIDRLTALPESELLHQHLADVAHRAAREAEETAADESSDEDEG